MVNPCLSGFDGRIAFESRLWDALDQGLLCPFHYFGVYTTRLIFRPYVSSAGNMYQEIWTTY